MSYYLKKFINIFKLIFEKTKNNLKNKKEDLKNKKPIKKLTKINQNKKNT